MLELTIALCGGIVALFLTLLIAILFKWEKTRLISGILMSVISVIAMVLFIYIQEINGNPDYGKEFMQFYFPILVLVFFIGIGLLSTIRSIWKH